MLKIPLTAKIPGMVVLGVLLTAMASGALAVFIGRNIIRARALEANVNSVQSYASAINFYLNNARSVLETVAEISEHGDLASTLFGISSLRPQMAKADVVERSVVSEILEHSKVFQYVMLLRPEGSVYLVEPYDLQLKLSRSDLDYADWYKKLISTGKTVVSNLHISVVTQRPTVTIATPIRGPGGNMVGILAAGLKLEELSQIGHGGAAGRSLERFGYVTDSRRLIVAHQAKPKYVTEQTDFSSLPPVRAALAGEQDAGQWFNPIEQEERLGAYMPLQDLGWAVVYVVPARVAFAPINALARNISFATAGLVILIGFGGWFFARQITLPLGALTAAAEKMAAGDLTQSIKVKTGDEIEQLANEFNKMADALSEKDVALRQRLEELRQANRELTAFTYSVSHDLHAPVRHIHGFAELLKKNASTSLDETNRHYLDTILESSKQLTSLIDDLLAFSRLGRAEMQKTEVSLEQTVKEAVKELSAEMAGRSITWKFDTLPTVYGDPSLLRIVFSNLLSNAIKFTRPRKEARIEIGTMNGDEAEVVVFVRDNGVGFDMKYVDKLFGIFQRLHRAEEFEGTGIGLASVQRIISRHGGRTWAESRPTQGRHQGRHIGRPLRGYRTR